MKLLILGDFFYDYETVEDDIKEISKFIKENNLTTILNFEGSMANQNENNKIRKGANLSMSKKSIEILKMLNVKAVSIANNHIMDYSFEGLNQVINILKQNDILYFGAGKNIEEAIKPIYLKIGEKTIAFSAMGWNMEECINAKKNKAGTAPLNFEILNDTINKTKCDIYIPILHMGYEYENLPQPYHLEKCREILKNDKVKLIIGHHPHVVQAYEKEIYYSLGNFYFGSRRNLFYNSKEKQSNYGIGVIFDTEKFETNIIHIIYNGEKTIIDKHFNNKYFVDISNVETKKYTKYFYNNNIFKQKKYVYKTGTLNEKIFNNLKYLDRNMKKKYLRNIKWPIIKKLKTLIKK